MTERVQTETDWRQKPLLTNVVVAPAAEYVRVDPGVYLAVCIGVQGRVLVRQFKRWRLQLEFVLFDPASVLTRIEAGASTLRALPPFFQQASTWRQPLQSE